MSEQTLNITSLNDFIFCPVSIYFHNLDHNADNMTFQCGDQLNGKAAHETIDNSTYSTSNDILTGYSSRLKAKEMSYENCELLPN